MRTVLLMLATLLGAGPAVAASADVECKFSDENLAFEAWATQPIVFGSPLVWFRGKLQIRVKSVPKDLRNLEFDKDTLIQQWNDSEHPKLRLWQKAGPWRVQLVVDTKRLTPNAADYSGPDYSGHYELTILGATEKVLTIRGRATCSG